jgi:hypothetical protein
VINANIISIGIFTLSVLLYFGSQKKIETLPLAKDGRTMYVFPVGEVMSNNF